MLARRLRTLANDYRVYAERIRRCELDSLPISR